MKNLVMIAVSITITFVVTMLVVMIKFGGFNISNHTDHYVTTCNGQVVNEYDSVVTDSITYDVSINQRFNIFNR